MAVKIRDNNGSLRLVFTYAGKRRFVSLGLKNTAQNQALATVKAGMLEADIRYNRVDETWESYRPAPSAPKPVAPEQVSSDSLITIWERYKATKAGTVSGNTIHYDWAKVERHITRSKLTSPYEAAKFKAYLLESTTAREAKKVITYLSAACNHAVDCGLIPANQFAGMAGKIKIKKKSGSDGNQIEPFTKDEMNCLIEGFKVSKHYRKYTHLIEFLFLTGCRPSEAIALEIGDIGLNAITFSKAIVPSENGKQSQSGLKTQEKREFPINDQLRGLLQRVIGDRTTGLLFPSPKGTYIHWENFTRRAWASVLDETGITYRNPYQTRHTFISHTLKAIKDPVQLARWVGNSPEIILKHYAGIVSETVVPNL